MKHVDLFSGIGGFSIGFERAGIETSVFCEKDAYCQQVLAKHWPEVPICPDIHDFPDWWEDHRVEGETYVVSAGFPCQPFSFTGKKEGVEDERWLWPETARAIRAVRPKYLLLENVAALTTYSDAFGQILSDISHMGFDAEWGVVSASEFGALHKRRRVIILSYPNSKYGVEGNQLGNLGVESSNFKTTRLPRPARSKGWIAQIAERESEPAYRRVVNGVPTRLLESRLRALGNSVYPATTEYYARVIAATEARGIF